LKKIKKLEETNQETTETLNSKKELIKDFKIQLQEFEQEFDKIKDLNKNLKQTIKENDEKIKKIENDFNLLEIENKR
jgi:hypothetical protein